MNPEVSRLLDLIESAKKDLEELQKSCAHKNRTIHMTSWRPGCFSPEFFCDECNDFVRDITDDERQALNKADCDFRKDWNRPFSKREILEAHGFTEEQLCALEAYDKMKDHGAI